MLGLTSWSEPQLFLVVIDTDDGETVLREVKFKDGIYGIFSSRKDADVSRRRCRHGPGHWAKGSREHHTHKSNFSQLHRMRSYTAADFYEGGSWLWAGDFHIDRLRQSCVEYYFIWS
jgi:hypothetical protein